MVTAKWSEPEQVRASHPDVFQTGRKVRADVASVVEKRPIGLKQSVVCDGDLHRCLSPRRVPDSEKSLQALSNGGEGGETFHEPFVKGTGCAVMKRGCVG